MNPAKEKKQKSKSTEVKRNPASSVSDKTPREPKQPKPRKTTKLQRLRVDENGVDLEVEKIPVHENPFNSLSEGEESEMEQEKSSENSFTAAASEDSWVKPGDPPDSWVNSAV